MAGASAPLKPCRRGADALPMAARPEYLETEQGNGVVRGCPDCGGPMGAAAEAGHRICQGCYDAYVDNAGR